MVKEKFQKKSYPEWVPDLVTIIGSEENLPEQLDYQRLLKKRSGKFGIPYHENTETLSFAEGTVNYFFSKEFSGDVDTVVIALGTKKLVNKSTSSSHTAMNMESFLENLKALLPEPNYENTIKLIQTNILEETEDPLPELMEDSTPIENAGVLKNSIIACAPTVNNRRKYILFHPEERDAANKVWKILSDISEISYHTWEIDHLYSNRHLMFEQIDASEKNTQYRINEILAEMRKPVDEMQPSDLEEVLREITIQFSRLSTMASSMRRDLVKTRSLRSRLREILDEWGEKPYREYRTNSSALLNRMDRAMAPFTDFIERVEALMTQLNTVLDSVRTYLSIKQQKINITQQEASKNQLVRLVNLQEILHKLEILIVAVYITEIFKTVIESLTHEKTHLYTALFIPIALVASLLISRTLHKTENSH